MPEPPWPRWIPWIGAPGYSAIWATKAWLVACDACGATESVTPAMLDDWMRKPRWRSAVREHLEKHDCKAGGASPAPTSGNGPGNGDG